MSFVDLEKLASQWSKNASTLTKMARQAKDISETLRVLAARHGVLKVSLSDERAAIDAAIARDSQILAQVQDEQRAFQKERDYFNEEIARLNAFISTHLPQGAHRLV